MRYRTVLVTALVVGLGTGLLAQQRGGRKVTGTVLSTETMRPLARAVVQYDEGGQETQTTTTDAKGYFEFDSGTSASSPSPPRGS